jgi:hypothetical protein
MRSKIHLDLSSLEVESFDTTSAALRRRDGTVFGQVNTNDSTCFEDLCTCETQVSCDASCQGGCGTASCGCGHTADTCYETCATGFQDLCQCP